MPRRRRRHKAPFVPVLMGKNDNMIHMFNNSVESDIDVWVGEGRCKRKFRSHRILLRLHSPVLKILIDLATTRESVYLPNDDPYITQLLIGFFYSDKELCNVPEALKLLQMANKYACPHIMGFCSNFIQSNLFIENVLDVYHVAHGLKHKELKENVSNEICGFIKTLVSTRPFLDMSRTNFRNFIKNKHWRSQVEELDIFNGIYNWVNAECRRKCKNGEADFSNEFRPFLTYINFSNMTLEDFTVHVVPKHILSKEDIFDVYLLYSKALAGNLSVKLDVSDMENYSRRYCSSHIFYLDQNVTLREIHFTLAKHTGNSSDQIVVGVRMGDIETYYMNEPHQLIVKFQPPLTIEPNNNVEIYWSYQYNRRNNGFYNEPSPLVSDMISTEVSEHHSSSSNNSNSPDENGRKVTSNELSWTFTSIFPTSSDEFECVFLFQRFL